MKLTLTDYRRDSANEFSIEQDEALVRLEIQGPSYQDQVEVEVDGDDWDRLLRLAAEQRRHLVREGNKRRYVEDRDQRIFEATDGLPPEQVADAIEQYIERSRVDAEAS